MIKSGLWVAAHVRRCHNEGLSCAIVRRGAEEAGTVFIRVIDREGKAALFAPAPGPTYDDEGRRRWRNVSGGFVTLAETDAKIQRETAIDPDIWIVDIDDPKGTGLLDVIVA